MGGVALRLAAAAVAAADSSEAARKALAKGGYPWYDDRADALQPVWPPAPIRLWSFGNSLDRLGDVLVIGLAAIALAALIAALVWAWQQYHPGAWASARAEAHEGIAARVGQLPPGLRPATADPWAEALRLRERGDYAGAIVCLFAHQLLALDRLQQVRLAPGRTGRQVVRSIADDGWRRPVAATLRLFEAAFYGQRAPTAEAFAVVWAEAEAFERRVAVGRLP